MVYKIFEFLQIWHFYFKFIKQNIPLAHPTEFKTLLLHIYFGFIYFAPLNYVDKCFCSFCSYVLYKCYKHTLLFILSLLPCLSSICGWPWKKKGKKVADLCQCALERKKQKVKRNYAIDLYANPINHQNLMSCFLGPF